MTAEDSSSSTPMAPGDHQVMTPPPKNRRPKAILKPGQVLANGYEVVEQIGEGGMAIVYKAVQKSLNRHVAIKALHPKLARDAEFIQRFEAESGALAALSHPNIVAIIDRGREDDVYYFVMEFVDGEDLDQKIIANKLTPNDWRHVVTSCASALDYVHKRGVVHRDIKPSNILMDSEGRVKVGDFGIAHIITGDALHDEEGKGGPAARAVGTAHYMAPEQGSDPANIDARADIFSLGVAFYKMMTRQLPVGEFPAPSAVNNQVPLAVDDVIFKALSANRDDRHPNVVEFCEDLLKALRDQSMSITSILNYRKGQSALYSGADFTKTSSGSGSSETVKKLKSDTSVKKMGPDKKSGGTTPVPPGKKSPTGTGDRYAGAGRVSASKDLTPLPVGNKGGAQAAAPKSNTMLIALVVVLLLAAGGIIAAVFMKGTPPPAQPAPVVDPGSNKSAAAEREERARKQLEERKKALLDGSLSSGNSTETAPAKP